LSIIVYLHGKENNPSARLQETIAMGAIRRIWAWLSDSRHQKTIAFFGGGLVIVVGAAWQLYIHFYPAKSSAPPTQVIEQHATEGGTAVVHTGKGDVYTGIPPERFQTLSEELGITRAALQNFFKILQLRRVPAEEYDSTLRKIAKTYKELGEGLDRFSSSDLTVTSLKEKAKEYLKSGDFEQAESFLNKAMVQDLEAARRTEKIAEARMIMISAAASMSEIGELKEIQLDYKEAASYYRQASESVPKGYDLILAKYLGMLGRASYKSGAYSAAEKPLTRSLMINEKVFGPDHPGVAVSLHNLAELYNDLGKYAEAEPLYMRSLSIKEKVLGPDHPNVAISLNNLALLYYSQGKYGEAEPLYMRCLAISEKVLGPDHPNVAISLNNLALLYRAQAKYGEAEPLYMRCLAIKEKALGPDHPDVATSLNNLALLYDSQGKYGEAEPLYMRCLAIWEKVFGPDHPNVAISLNNLALLYTAQGKYAEAEPLYMRCLAIKEKVFGPNHPEVAVVCKNMAELYRKIGKKEEVDKLEERADRISSIQ
jgi:tetratricopeptide (TPR) repeat protein